MADTPTAASADQPRRWKYTLLKVGYCVAVVVIGLAVMEGAARYMGLGDPVLHYNDIWGGMRPVPNQRVARLGGATVTIDANGFRTPVPDEAGALRILFLGDSVMWGGSSVDDTELFTEVAANVLREKGRPVYAMNAGVNGTALLNHAERFQGYDGKLDALVWLFPWGDTNRCYASAGALWPARHKPRLALVELVDYVLYKYWERISRFVPATEDDFLTPQGPAGDASSFEKQLAERKKRNLEAVRSVVAAAKNRGVPVVIGVTPYRKGDQLEPLPPDAVSFLDEMAATGVMVFDVSAALTQAPGGMDQLYIDHAHVNAAGHRRIGAALGKALEAVVPAKEQ